MYLYEEELLNEAIQRGCGRGYIRAERKRGTNSQKEHNQRVELTTNIPPYPQIERDNIYQPQMNTWIQQPRTQAGKQSQKL